MRYGKAKDGSDARRQYLAAVEQYPKLLKEWDKRNPDGDFSLDDLPPDEPTKVYVSDDGVYLTVYSGNWYPIFLNQSDVRRTYKSLVWWVHHLSHKTWCDRLLIADFIDAYLDHFGLEGAL